jgi:peroxiredoxin
MSDNTAGQQGVDGAEAHEGRVRRRVRPDPVRGPAGARGLTRGSLAAGLTTLALALTGGATWWYYHRETPEPDAVLRVEMEHVLLPDTSGRMQTLTDGRDRAVVLFFIGVECPVSNAYAPMMTGLAGEFGPRGVAFWGILTDPDARAEAAASHRAEHGLNFPVLLDNERDLPDQAGVTVTPEAVVLDPNGLVLYRGRIDDRYSNEGRRRKSAGSHDLRDAIEAVLAGRTPAVAVTRAFGCPLPKARTASTGEEVTFSKHVAPILWRRCAGCHRPSEVGPFPLLTYQDAAKRSGFIRDVTASRRMPPWKPRHGFGEFLEEARLSGHELATLAGWADAGAPEGDPDDLPAPPSFPPPGWQLGQPDLVLSLPEPFVVPPGEDVYRAFALPTGLARPQEVAAIEFRADNRRVVHHARFYLDPTPDCRRRDQADPAPGFATIGGNDIPKANLGAWNPGVSPRMPPPGIGFGFPPGSDLVLLLHYHGAGKPEPDRSSVGLYFAKAPVTRSMSSIPISTVKIDIPAGEPRHRIAQHATLPADVHAYSVLPHGHYLMREIKLWADLPDGTTRRLLWIDDWDLNWQGVYHFAEPVALPRGTKLHVIATYDNSEANPSNPNRPPKRVRFGPASTDEMLGCHVQILPDRPEDDRVIRKKWPYSL